MANLEPRTAGAMRVPLLDLKAQHASIRDEVYAAIEEVVEAQWFILGPEVAALEEEIARLSEAAHGVGCSSGTDALLMALMAFDVGPGDEVVTTPYTFFATGGVIARLGARPVFADIDPATFNLDTDQAAAALTERTRAVMPVHLFGRVAPLDGLLAVTAPREIPVIEDAAQAIGATGEDGRVAGSSALCGCLSFFPSKNLGGYGDGGMVVTSDEALATRLRRLRVHGGITRYLHDEVGGNFRLDALQAAVLRVKLRHLPAWSQGRRRNAERYRRLVGSAGIDDVVTLPADVPGHIYNQFVIRAPRRDELKAALLEDGIQTEVYYPTPLHLQPCFAELGYGIGAFPHAEAAARETLALPIYPELSDDQAAYVVERIAAFYQDDEPAGHRGSRTGVGARNP